MAMGMALALAMALLVSVATAAGAEGEADEGAEAISLHVSPAGDDRNAGTEDKPFATLPRAQRALRELRQRKPQASLELVLVAGTYLLDKPLVLTRQDSGAAGGGHTAVRAASDDRETRLIGGRRIGGFKPVTDKAVLTRLPEPARGKVVQTSLKDQGITDYGELTPRGFGKTTKKGHLELFFDGQRMPLAGWPNEGWATLGWAPGKQPAKLPPKGQRPITKDHFFYEGDRPSRWLTAEDLWVHGYWKQDWADGYVKVKAIDPTQRRIDTHEPHGVYGCVPGQRWRALNLIEELDAPGEWWLDRKTGVLYFWPPSPVEKAEVIVSMLDGPIILVDNASRVRLASLTLECSRGNGVEVRGGRDVLLLRCTIRDLGGSGVVVDGGDVHSVAGCHIHDVGEAGIQLRGGDRKTLQPAGHSARRNHIHHYAQWCRTYRPAVGVSGVGNTVQRNLIHDGPHVGIQLGGNDHLIELNEIHHVALETGDTGVFYKQGVGVALSGVGCRASHNLIHDCPRFAFLFGGNDHLIEFNEIHSVCTDTGDVGAFYMGRDWTARGTVIRHNYFHDIHGLNMGANAVYLDDAASGITVEGNIFRDVNRAAFIGGGRDNRVADNVFVDCKVAVHVDARGLGWAAEHVARGGGWRMYEKLRSVAYDKPPYSERYPELARILEGDPRVPLGNVIERNLCTRSTWLELPGVKREWLTIRNNLTEEDPRFIDPAKGDFRLREDSPAWKLGFVRIPVERIGPEGQEPEKGPNEK